MSTNARTELDAKNLPPAQVAHVPPPVFPDVFSDLQGNIAEVQRGIGDLTTRVDAVLARPAGADDGRLRGARTSPEIAELLGALARAQGAIGNVAKDNVAQVKSEKGSYSYTYADLASAINACRASLAANDLSVLQIPRVIYNDHGRPDVRLATILGHKSGQWLETSIDLPVGKPDAQGIGSAITYARRYALMSILGMAGADDDGNEAIGASAQTGPRTPPKHDPPAQRGPRAAPPEAFEPGKADDAWASVADQVSARVVEAGNVGALRVLAKDIKALPEPFQAKVKAQYDARYRELSPAPANGGAS